MAATERVRMETIEKLMVQIFEKKSRILDQVKKQTRLFDRHLASKLLIDGIAPPPWLLPPDLPSRTSDPAELNAEDFISEVLLSRGQSAIPFSHIRHSVFNKPVVEATNGQLLHGLCTEEVCAENKDFDEGDKPCSDAGCASVGVPELNHCIAVPQDQRNENHSIATPQDQRDTRISDINHDLALSLARLQRSKSRQRALELRNSAKEDRCPLEDDNNLSGCSRGIDGSVVPFLQVDQLEEMNSVKPLNTSNDIGVVKDIKLGDTWSKEKGGRIDSREDIRFRSPGLQQSSLNVGSSSNVIREDGAMFTDSVGLSIQQSNHGNQPSEPVSNSLIGDQNYRKTEPKVGNKRCKEKGSNTDFVRITRSKRSTEQDNHVTELFKLDGSCNNHKEWGTSSLTQQAQPFDRGTIIKSADVVEASAGMKGGTHDYSGRITRSRSSRQPCNTVYDLSKPVRLLPGQKNQELCVVGGTEHSTKRNSAEGYISRSKGSQASPTLERLRKPSHSNINAHVSAEKPLAIQGEQELFAENSTDASDVENNVEECDGKNTRMKPSFTAEVTSELVSSQDLGHRVTRSRSSSLCKSQESKSLNSSERIGSNVSGLDVKYLPCASTNQPSNKEGCAATVMETEIVPIEPVEAQHASSNGDGVVGLETLAPCPNDSSMLVPKQLNFDDVEASSFNKMSAHAVRNKNKRRLLEKTPPVLLEDAGILDKAMAEIYQKNNSLSPDERVDLSKEEEPQRDSSEVRVEDMSTAAIALDENVVSPVKETSHVEKDMVTHNLQQSDKNSKERTCLTGNLVTIQAAWESMPASLPNVVTISSLSDVNAHRGMDSSPETETGALGEAEPTELVTKDSELETFSIDQELSKDGDFLQVTKPDPCVNQEACTDHEVELPCAVSKDSMGNLEHLIVNSEMLQCHTAEPLDGSGHKDTSVERSQSPQLQITKKSGAANSSSVDGSRSQNKRKRSNLFDNLSNSPGLKENAVLSVNKDCESRDVLNEEHSPKVVLESQDVQVSQEHFAQPAISRSQTEELHQIEEHNMTEDSKSSPKLQIETAHLSLEGSGRNANTSLAFTNKEQEASLVPTEVRHAAEDCESHLIGERDVDPAMIIYDGEWQGSLQENGNSYQLEDKFETKNVGCLTNGETLMLEEKSDLVEASKFSYCSDVSPHSASFYLTCADETIPVLERFIMPSDDEQPCNADEGISFDKLKLSNTAIERAGILEQLCISACMQTPVSCSLASYKHKSSNLYQSVPTGLLEGMDIKDKPPISEEVCHLSHARSHSDCLPSTTSPCDGDTKKLCTSPVSKVWDRIIKSGSSEKRRSLNPELPCIDEENENVEDIADAYREGIGPEMLTGSVKREPLAEIDANLAISEAESCAYRFSMESVNTEFSFNGIHNRAKKNHGDGRSTQRRYNNKENETLGATSLKGKPGSLNHRFTNPKLSAKTNSRKGGLSVDETETKRSNIVSNIASFIPLVQQKQAPAVIAGKRDVKVTALEAAEAAKRAAEKKENERKLKKEAMKLERARQREEEELQKKKKEKDRKKKEADMAAKKRQREEEAKKEKERKEEERKKKEADMAAKKRQREEEEKKEKERKRLRIEESRKQQKEHEQKLQAAKEEKTVKGQNMEQKGHEIRESKDEKRNYKIEKVKGDDNCLSIYESEPTTTRASTSDDRRAGIVQKDCEASTAVGNSLKGQVSLANNLDKPTRTENLVATTRQERSYDISPYKGSDDEDDEDEDTPSGKFVPSWASKNRIALAVFSQDEVDPATIFPPESFCSKAEGNAHRQFFCHFG